jgi:SAM-dependent methyltransferase
MSVARVEPLHSSKFEVALRQRFRHALGSDLYEFWVSDHLQKVDRLNAGYGQWILRATDYLAEAYNLGGRNILDIGCGMGELVVRLRVHGWDVFGVDLDNEVLCIGSILALENGYSSPFTCSSGLALPFPDQSFDLVMLFSVLEHIDDMPLRQLAMEVRRVLRGVAYAVVPNRLLNRDPHTGLAWVPYMPRNLAERYIRLRGSRYRYLASMDGQWDVHYRTFYSLRGHLSPWFEIAPMPREFVFPPFEISGFVCAIGVVYRIGHVRIPLCVPLPAETLVAHGLSPLHFQKYINFILIPK